jgi:mannosyltransferase
MTVLLDNIIFGLQPHGGISVYWAEMLARAARAGYSWTDPYSPPGNESRASLKDFSYNSPRFTFPPAIERYRGVNAKGSIIHSSYYRVPTDSKTPLITTVYDFTYERYRKGPALWVHHAQKMRAIQRSAKILCISESTARDVVHYGGKHLAPRITVTHLAASPAFRPIENPITALSGKYPWLEPISRNKKILLFVGARSRYKRFDLAVKATEAYPDSHLIVLGGGAPTKQEQDLTQSLALEQRISFVTAVPTTELPAWYSSAFALLYLSDYEGFGLPILEAAQCECPIIAQKNSSLVEVYGHPEALIRPENMLGRIVDTLQLLDTPNFRSETVTLCNSHAKSFTWNKCWQQTADVYRSI